MCSGAVRAAVSSVFDDEDFSLGAPRMILAQESAKVILALVDAGENNREAFDNFSVVVMDKLNSAAAVSANAKNFSSQREMMWSKFHQIRTSELPKLWNELCTTVKVPAKNFADPMLAQYVFEKLFEGIVKTKAETDNHQAEVALLTENEHNALRYAAGYVVRKLQGKFNRTHHPHKEDFMVCLNQMVIFEDKDVSENSYLDYTKRWIQIVDRGGLVHIKDEFHCFLYEVEMQVRKHLLHHFTPGKEVDKQFLIDRITTDGSVQFQWSFVSIDLDEEVGNELLVEMVNLWLTLRGFSIAGAFVEQYKQCSKKGTKKSTGLRRGLKRRNLEVDSASDTSKKPAGSE